MIAAGKWLTVSAAQLNQVRFHAADFTTIDSLRIGASDGRFWGYRNVKVATIGEPEVGTDGRVILDQLEERSFSDLVGQTDSGPSARLYQFYDSNTNPLSATVVDGMTPFQAGVVHTVTAAQFEQLMVKGGTYDNRSFDDLYVRINNGEQWSDWDKLTVRTEPHYLDSLLTQGWRDFISPPPGSPLVITYSFMQRTSDYYPDGPERTNFREFDNNMREGARRALGYWASVAEISFVEVPETVGGIIRFGTADRGGPGDPYAWAYLPGSSSPMNEGVFGDVWLNNSGYPASGIPARDFLGPAFGSKRRQCRLPGDVARAGARFGLAPSVRCDQFAETHRRPPTTKAFR